MSEFGICLRSILDDEPALVCLGGIPRVRIIIAQKEESKRATSRSLSNIRINLETLFIP